ncbi:sugar phosphate isomerase/epimerase family protein [Singulisphaera sp. Ch08]|uniref:Sugar phosphate isomerase/epimerase family protein n=1 Tax=Singulisphaera sp. Ch08 TaxID=3120278 RepID=A0AAU7CU04_9BACT
MRLAVSNIAWPSGADADAAKILADHGAEGVEIAPTKVWPRPLDADESDVLAYRKTWEQRGLRVVALQALLFGRPDLVLFGDGAVHRQTIDYLKGMIDLASALGAGALVFGSPKNRLIGDRPREEADVIATAIFRELGDYAANSGTAFCIEANPAAYGCDFVTSTVEAAELVARVDSEGFGLHLDTGGMTLSGEDPVQTVVGLTPRCRHFHASEPHLAPVGRGGADHPAFRTALRAVQYEGWVSIEMKEAVTVGAWLETLRDSLVYSKAAYAISSQGTPTTAEQSGCFTEVDRPRPRS